MNVNVVVFKIWLARFTKASTEDRKAMVENARGSILALFDQIISAVIDKSVADDVLEDFYTYAITTIIPPQFREAIVQQLGPILLNEHANVARREVARRILDRIMADTYTLDDGPHPLDVWKNAPIARPVDTVPAPAPIMSTPIAEAVCTDCGSAPVWWFFFGRNYKQKCRACFDKSGGRIYVEVDPDKVLARTGNALVAIDIHEECKR